MLLQLVQSHYLKKMAWVSIKLSGYFVFPDSERKVWPYKVNKVNQVFVFSFRTDNAFVFAKLALGKPLRQKFAKYYNLTSTLDLVHGIRSQVLAVNLAKR